MQVAELAGQRIAILGAGREGRAAYAWLRKRLPSLPLTIIAESVPDAAFLAGVANSDQVLVEPLTSERLTTFDLIVRSPGISIYREPLQRARAAGVKFTSPSSLWFAAHPDARTICITGTKGKSTTSALVAHMLQFCGFTVRLAGNIGKALLDFDEQGVDWWVIELSSYQLADLEAAPSLSVILNLSPEHLDWHGGDENYRSDKLRLAALTSRGKVIVNAADDGLLRHFQGVSNVVWCNDTTGVHVRDKRIYYQQQELPVEVPAGLPGQHNLMNTAAALTVAMAVGADVFQAARAVASFEALPHRLQFLGVRDGITYVNDSIATTPVSTLAALEAWHYRPVVLIVGGFDRGLDWKSHGPEFLAWAPRAVIGLPQNGPRIIESLRDAGLSPPGGYHPVPDLAAAVNLARQLANTGDVVLLSPGAPSFPHFVDFQDRGHHFTHLCGF